MIVSRFIHSLGAKGDDPGKSVFPQQKPKRGNLGPQPENGLHEYRNIRSKDLGKQRRTSDVPNRFRQ